MQQVSYCFAGTRLYSVGQFTMMYDCFYLYIELDFETDMINVFSKQ